METYAQYTRPAPSGYKERTCGLHDSDIRKINDGDSADDQEIPFDPYRLPVFPRRRLASPVEAKPVKRRARVWTPTPRSIPLISTPRTSALTPVQIQTTSPDRSLASAKTLSRLVPWDRSPAKTPAPQTRNLPPTSTSTTPKHIRFDDNGYPSSLPFSPNRDRRWIRDYTETPSLITPNNPCSSRASSLLFTPETPLPLDCGLHPPPLHALTLRPEVGDLPLTPESINVDDDGLSDCDSPPDRLSIRLLTPETPIHLRHRLPPLDYIAEPSRDKQTQYKARLQLQPWTSVIHLTPPITPPTIRTSRLTTECSTPSGQGFRRIPSTIPIRPKLLHHVSSDGGPIAALKRYITAKHLEPSVSGMSLFLHCPKKRIALHSMGRVEKERKCAMEWSQLERVSGLSESAKS